MEPDAYGIPKPKDTEMIVPTLLFVPCVGYAAGGYRLGYGGGFYDRTLATLQPKALHRGAGLLPTAIWTSSSPKSSTCRWTPS